MDLVGWLPCRGRGGWRGEHRVWLCGLWRTEHYTQWGRPLLLQHGQSLAMMAFRGTVTKPVSPDGEEGVKTFQKKKNNNNKQMEEQEERTVILLYNWAHFFYRRHFFSFSKHVKVTFIFFYTSELFPFALNSSNNHWDEIDLMFTLIIFWHHPWVAVLFKPPFFQSVISNCLLEFQKGAFSSKLLMYCFLQYVFTESCLKSTFLLTFYTHFFPGTNLLFIH